MTTPGSGSTKTDLTELAYRRAQEVLAAALLEAKQMKIEAAEEIRREREASLASIARSLQAVAQEARATSESLMTQTQTGLDAALPVADISAKPARTRISEPAIKERAKTGNWRELRDTASFLNRKLDLVSLAAFVGIGIALAIFLFGPANVLLPFRFEAVHSASMSPTIPKGSVIVVKKTSADDVRKGDILSFHPPGKADTLETHRVMDIEDGESGKAFVTQGDANPLPDSWRVDAAGSGWRYVFHIPYLGYVLAAMRLPSGIMLLAVPSLVTGIAVLMVLWRPGRSAQPA